MLSPHDVLGLSSTASEQEVSPLSTYQDDVTKKANTISNSAYFLLDTGYHSAALMKIHCLCP